MGFWQGFTKKASQMLKWNALGGIEPAEPETIERAQLVELKTLAADVEGANCSNCKWSRPLPDDTSLCNHPEVVQEVTPKMLCAKWENPGSIFAGSGEDKAKELQQEQEMAANGEEGQQQQMDQAGQELGLDEPGEGGAGMPQPGAGPQATPEGAEMGQPKAPAAGASGEPQPDAAQATGGSGNKTEAALQGKEKLKAKPKKKDDSKDSKKDDKGGANTININVGGEKKASAMRGFLSE